MADPSDSTTTTTSAAPAATSSSASNEIEINIRAPGDKKSSVTIDPSKTVAELKALVATKTDIEADRQRLIYSGRVLKDEEKVEVYKIRWVFARARASLQRDGHANPPSERQHC